MSHRKIRVKCRIFYSSMIFWSRTLSNGILRRRGNQSMRRAKPDTQIIMETTRRSQPHQSHWTAINKLWANGTLQLIRIQSWGVQNAEGELVSLYKLGRVQGKRKRKRNRQKRSQSLVNHGRSVCLSDRLLRLIAPVYLKSIKSSRTSFSVSSHCLSYVCACWKDSVPDSGGLLWANWVPAAGMLMRDVDGCRWPVGLTAGVSGGSLSHSLQLLEWRALCQGSLHWILGKVSSLKR